MRPQAGDHRVLVLVQQAETLNRLPQPRVLRAQLSGLTPISRTGHTGTTSRPAPVSEPTPSASQYRAQPGPRGWLTPTAWNLLHPTRLAFEGVAWLALLTAALAAVYSWRDKAPAWALILGFALLWTLGALAAYALHRSFNRSAST